MSIDYLAQDFRSYVSDRMNEVRSSTTVLALGSLSLAAGCNSQCGDIAEAGAKDVAQLIGLLLGYVILKGAYYIISPSQQKTNDRAGEKMFYEDRISDMRNRD